MLHNSLDSLGFPKKCADPAELIAFGKAVGATLKAGSVVALVGTLGAGKTHLTKGLVAHFGGKEEDVTSPTFTLVHEYEGTSLPIYHFDFYRMESAAEVETLGWDDYLDRATAAECIIIVEWANIFPEMMPKETIWLEIDLDGEGRSVSQRS